MSGVHLTDLLLRAARAPRAGERCPVCDTIVLGDDAIGLVSGHCAHAECALHAWAEDRPGRRNATGRGESHLADRAGGR
jgi:hypothetical protein